MSAPDPPPTTEETLRQELRAALRNLNRREPLEGTYKRLLLQNGRLATPPILPRDKFYKKVDSNLRTRVSAFLSQTAGKDPLDRLAQRKPLEEAAMRAALTLREAKEHEQQALLEATLASFPRQNGMDEGQRKRYFDSIAVGLQSKKPRKLVKTPPPDEVQQTEQARQHADWERQRAQAKAREDARRKREEEERKRRDTEMRRKPHVETPQQALHKIYYPIYIRLWEMDFAHLGGTNPFRIVIDRDNCTAVGAPDYFDIIETPMNLTYIQRKVDNMEYDSLKSFFDDCELMLKNGIIYNSDQTNPYRIAAEEMKKKYMKMKKKLLQTIQQKQRK
jgi:hypothetical protein